MGDSGSKRSRETLPVMLRVLLVIGFLIAIAATVIMVIVDDVRLLRLAVVLALWAALIGAFAVGRSRRDARAAAMRENDAQLAYELELSREISARREYEADLTRQMAEHQSEQIGELREQLGRLTEVLSSLADGELTVSRLTMSAELARFRSRERVESTQPAAVTVGDTDEEEAELVDVDADADAVDFDEVPEDAPVDAEEAPDAPVDFDEVPDAPVDADELPDAPVDADETDDRTGAEPEPRTATETVPAAEPQVRGDAAMNAGTDRHAGAAGSAPADEDVPAAVWAHDHVARTRARASVVSAPSATEERPDAAPEREYEPVTDAAPEPEPAPMPHAGADTDAAPEPRPETEPHADADTEPDGSSGGVSVSELLAAYGLSGQSRRRRRE